MTVLDEISAAAKERFPQVWENGDRQEAFELCNEIREEIDVPPYTWKKFDEGFQYLRIFHEAYEIAEDEFVNLVFGWW